MGTRWMWGVLSALPIAALSPVLRAQDPELPSGRGTQVPPATEEDATPGANIDAAGSAGTPAARPILEVSTSAAVPIAPRGDGLSRGRAFSLLLFVRPLPYLGIGAYFEHRAYDWEARGSPEFSAPHEKAWANTWGGLIRGYPLSTGRFEPYAELGVAAAASDGTLHSIQCGEAPTTVALRVGLGLDAYVSSWLRLGATSSFTGRVGGGVEICSADLVGNEPPDPPDSGIGGLLGVAATFTVPRARRAPPSTVAPGQRAIQARESRAKTAAD